MECVSALYHNKRKTNYHIHLIFSERERSPEPIEKTAARNMFYDEQGNTSAPRKRYLAKTEQIQTDNGYRMRWNREVDRAIVSGVAET